MLRRIHPSSFCLLQAQPLSPSPLPEHGPRFANLHLGEREPCAGALGYEHPSAAALLVTVCGRSWIRTRFRRRRALGHRVRALLDANGPLGNTTLERGPRARRLDRNRDRGGRKNAASIRDSRTPSPLPDLKVRRAKPAFGERVG
jgi:hypothetical protein